MMQRLKILFCFAVFVAFDVSGDDSLDQTYRELRELHESGSPLEPSNERSIIDEVVIAILKPDSADPPYCLYVNREPPSEILFEKLAKLGQVVRTCEGKKNIDIFSVEKIRELENGKITAIYGTHIADLRAGGAFLCLLQRTMNGELELEQCEMFMRGG